MESTFTLATTVRTHPPAHPYHAIKDAILGKRYQLTLTFVGKTHAADLNRTYRQKMYTPNVLSFPLDATCGEIYICPAVARREAHRYHLTPDAYIGFLFIHGCLHLKGYRHGATMERAEQRFMKRFILR